MGQLVDGIWHTGWYDPDKKGAFRRPPTQFRGHAGPQGGRADPKRFHLYVSYACPWAHRALIIRAERGLDIGVTAVDAKMSDDGWSFGGGGDADPLFGKLYLREVYTQAQHDYTGRVTVPVLWDKTAGTIVNNESREVMRILDTEFEGRASLAPLELRAAIDETLTRIYEPLNNGVYKAGFATTQEAYLCGDVFTEADVALFTTLIRFDLVYYSHFKCNLRRIQDYAHLWEYVRDIYQRPAVKPTCHLEPIKTHYYWSQTTVNPHRVVPLGPTIDFDSPHERG